MTNQQGAPEALFYADALDRCAEVDFDHIFVPAAAVIRRLHAENERLAALVEAQQPATHVQDQAEIEHVAGDVSKNGTESNMAQQPAPSAAAMNFDPHAELRKTWQPGQRWQTRTMRHGVWGDWSDTIFGRPLWFAHQQYRRHPDEIATQPSTTPQADSQPAPVEVVDAMADSQYLAGVSAGWNAANADDPNAALQKLQESRAGYLKPLRAARAPADSVPPMTATGTGPKPVTDADVRNMSARVISGQAEEDELLEFFARLAPPHPVHIAAAPTPPTQAADSQPTHQRDTSYPPLPECDATTVGLGAVWNRHNMRAYVDADRIARAQADSVCYDYAKQIAESMWATHYKADAPHWESCDSLMGVLSQISNMMCGLSRAQADSVTAASGWGVTGPEWKWVPVDATDAMVRATDKVNFENEDTDGTIHNVWNTMLAAAPTPPATPSAASIAWNALRDLTDPLGEAGLAEGSADRAQADSVTAPAGPSKSLPYEPTSAMLIAARERDPALPIETVRAIYWSMWRTATTPPAQAADSQPAKVPTSATGGDWTQPTTVALRLGDAMQLLCGGKRPPDDMVQQWLDNTSESLQEFAASNGPAWAQGIGLIDAALVMVDQPTEVTAIDNPDRDHERRAARAARAQAADSVLEDAARYRWLAEHCRSTSEHWGGRWSIIVDGPAPKSHDSEDDFDAAIDDARKQGGA